MKINKSEFQKIFQEEKEKVLKEKEKLSKEEVKSTLESYFKKYGLPRSRVELFEGVHEVLRKSGSVNKTKKMEREKLKECIEELYEEERGISEAVKNYWENEFDEQ